MPDAPCACWREMHQRPSLHDNHCCFRGLTDGDMTCGHQSAGRIAHRDECDDPGCLVFLDIPQPALFGAP